MWSIVVCSLFWSRTFILRNCVIMVSIAPGSSDSRKLRFPGSRPFPSFPGSLASSALPMPPYRRQFERVGKGDLPPDFLQADGRKIQACATMSSMLEVPVGTTLEQRACIELPDYQICRDYANWYTEQPIGDDTVKMVVTSQEQWYNRKEDAKATLTRLFAEGKPAIHAVMTFNPGQ